MGTVYPFLDGGHGFSDKPGRMPRLDVQNRPKRRISLCGDGRAPSQVPPVSLETPIVPVCQASFQPGLRMFTKLLKPVVEYV